jgi:hypothetical protein
VVLCHGMFCLAGRADAAAGGGMRRTHADALPAWPGLPRARDHAGGEWLEADHGERDGVGLGALAAHAHVDAVVPGPVWPGEGALTAHRACGTRPQVTDRPLALPGDRSAASGCGPEGRVIRRERARVREGLEDRGEGRALVWGTRCGARVRRANRGGGGVAHPGLHRRRERLQDRVRDPARSPRRAGCAEPESPTDQAATSTRRRPKHWESPGTVAA